jgi:hypothetical protein
MPHVSIPEIILEGTGSDFDLSIHFRGTVRAKINTCTIKVPDIHSGFDDVVRGRKVED